MNHRRGLAATLLLAGVNLRLAVAAVPPVLTQIRHSTGMSSALGGVLTGLPVFCFGLAALSAPWLIRRLHMGPLLGLALLTVAAGTALRLVHPLGALFAGTVVLACGIAVGNVLVPSLIKRDFPRHRVLMTSLYSVALAGSSATAAGLTVPIEHATGLGWRGAVALWGTIALLAVLLWTPRVRRERDGAAGSPGAPVRRLWRDPLAWCVTGFMGLQSFSFYALLSWLPTILESHGDSAAHAGWMSSFATFVGILTALSAPLIERRLGFSWLLVSLACTFTAGGILGLTITPMSGTYAWCALLGLGSGAELSLALGYIVGRAPDPHRAAHLSTMAQSIGYLIASAGPFLVGALHGATGHWTLPLIVLLVAVAPMWLTGLIASQDRHVLADQPPAPAPRVEVG